MTGDNRPIPPVMVQPCWEMAEGPVTHYPGEEDTVFTKTDADGLMDRIKLRLGEGSIGLAIAGDEGESLAEVDITEMVLGLTAGLLREHLTNNSMLVGCTVECEEDGEQFELILKPYGDTMDALLEDHEGTDN